MNKIEAFAFIIIVVAVLVTVLVWSTLAHANSAGWDYAVERARWTVAKRNIEHPASKELMAEISFVLVAKHWGHRRVLKRQVFKTFPLDDVGGVEYNVAVLDASQQVLRMNSL